MDDAEEYQRHNPCKDGGRCAATISAVRNCPDTAIRIRDRFSNFRQFHPWITDFIHLSVRALPAIVHNDRNDGLSAYRRSLPPFHGNDAHFDKSGEIPAKATTAAAMRKALTTSRILLFDQTVTTTYDSGCHHR
jgi:hypothetical protein